MSTDNDEKKIETSKVGEIQSKRAGGPSADPFTIEISHESSSQELVSQIASKVAVALKCDYVTVQLSHEGTTHKAFSSCVNGDEVTQNFKPSNGDGALFEISSVGGLLVASFRGQQWNLPVLVNDLQRARIASELALELAVRKVRSCGVFSIVENGNIVGIIECLFLRTYHRWKQEELASFQGISFKVQEALTQRRRETEKDFSDQLSPSITDSLNETADELKNQYSRLARYGNVVILLTDANFEIKEVVGNTEQLLGISISEMLHNPSVWDDLLDPRDKGILRRRILRLKSQRDELREELRFIHQRSGDVRWMMLRALPQFSADGAFIGWEGFGIDTTDRRRAQEALMGQNRRLEAVFEVSRAIQGQTDTAFVTLKGLNALIGATSSDCGYGCFSLGSSIAEHSRDQKEEPAKKIQLEVVASVGLSEAYLNGVDAVLSGPSLLTYSVDKQEGLLVHDLLSDPRSLKHIAKMDNLRSTIVAPLVLDGTVFGAIVLFKHEAHGYSEADFELVTSAATQITLAVRQAELYENERRHTETLRALYRISHELSKHKNPKEIAEHAFPLLQQEFALRRMWFGVLNEQGTHLVGKAGVGPGMRKQLQEIQIELNLRHDFLDQSLRTQQPVFAEPGEPMECSGLNKIMKRLKVESLGVIPLVSLGQVVGALIVEPMQPKVFKRREQLQLLASMANEMAMVLMSRRFEDKMSDALKMRMAGLLASGVAHNFNNLLQAVLGQVALIEMQTPKGSPALEATKTINEAAKRGASLVSQLLNFASQGSSTKQSLSLNRILTDSRELYHSLLGTRIELDIEIDKEVSEVIGDLSQIQQVVTNLLANAKDAIGNRQGGKVLITAHKVRLRSSEIDPELAPGVYVRVDIKDNGVGMNGEQQMRCFEPFYTTKNVDRSTGVGLAGSGLGLSAAYSMIKQHEGIITVQSVPGDGAVFSIFLPAAGQTMLADDVSTAAIPLTNYPKEIRGGILHLGVESGVQPFVKSIFDSLGFKSRGVFDYIQAHEILERDPGKWKFIMIDGDSLAEDLPNICTQLLARHSDIGIVITSASMNEYSEYLPQSPRIELLEKPFGVWSIEGALGRLSIRIQSLKDEVQLEISPSGKGNDTVDGNRIVQRNKPGARTEPSKQQL